MTRHRIFTTSFASVHPHYVAKAEKKGRSRAEVDEIICWLTGYGPEQLAARLEDRTDFKTFFAEALRMYPARSLIKGTSLDHSRGPPSDSPTSSAACAKTRTDILVSAHRHGLAKSRGSIHVSNIRSHWPRWSTRGGEKCGSRSST
ncbi:DUF2200 family protein [Paracoccus sp. PS-1]|uniref:DUF2200 family protein n=1 Tax=unclassified Paracoccus (in: a-proteobacteria) TaxID=2688777 RepID=UPI001E435EFD|nr:MULTISPECIES: DUF2200 family protein [unclassified Paracoccus (in: a-proteobacteria)]MDQ7261393.1 DUF2200 family protein [Paracoccus sp. PS1]